MYSWIFDFTLFPDSFTHSLINLRSFLRPSNILQFGSRELSFMIMAIWFVLIVHFLFDEKQIVLSVLSCYTWCSIAPWFPYSFFFFYLDIKEAKDQDLIKKVTLHIFILNKINSFQSMQLSVQHSWEQKQNRYAQINSILFLTHKNIHRLTPFL